MNGMEKPFVVMDFYHYEGWSVVAECDTLDQAVLEREHYMGMGNSNVQIVRPVHLTVTEARQSAPSSGVSQAEFVAQRADMTEAGK